MDNRIKNTINNYQIKLDNYKIIIDEYINLYGDDFINFKNNKLKLKPCAYIKCENIKTNKRINEYATVKIIVKIEINAY